MVTTIVAIVSGYFYFNSLVSRPNDNQKPADTVEVKEGASSAEVAESLEQLGAIRSSWAFLFYTKLSGRKIRAGVYSLPYNLSIKELSEKFSSGEYLLTKITIPEGKRIEQIGAMLEDKKIFAYKDVISAAAGSEGNFFPDTYYISRKTTASEFLQMMRDEYKKRTSGMNVTKEQLILASIIERESVNDEERPLVAGVYANRLAIDMKLEADPTVLYAHDSQFMRDITPYEATQYTFWQPIEFSLYRTIASPYNTYVNYGLPIAPICSPGLASIKAAQAPMKHNYYFFLHDAQGQIYPAENLQQHNKNIQDHL